MLQTGLFLIGANLGGLAGALIGQAVAILLAHPFLVWLAWRNGVWDLRHDALFFGVVLVLVLLALGMNAEALSSLWLDHA